MLSWHLQSPVFLSAKLALVTQACNHSTVKVEAEDIKSGMVIPTPDPTIAVLPEETQVQF